MMYINRKDSAGSTTGAPMRPMSSHSPADRDPDDGLWHGQDSRYASVRGSSPGAQLGSVDKAARSRSGVSLSGFAFSVDDQLWQHEKGNSEQPQPRRHLSTDSDNPFSRKNLVRIAFIVCRV